MALEEALSLVNQSGLHFWDSVLYRLKGEVLLQESKKNRLESEALFQKALKVAQEQGVIALELLAAISLGRLCLSLNPAKRRQKLQK